MNPRRKQLIDLFRSATAATILAAVCVLGLSSCREGTPAAESASAIEEKVERGPVTVVVTADRDEITIAGHLRFTIEVVAEEAYEVELPPFGDKLEQFRILDYETSQPELVGTSRVRIVRSYVLDPFLSGEYKIPPMKILFWKKGEQIAQKYNIETKELTITVTSLLPEKIAELKIHDIAAPAELPRSRKAGVWFGIAGAVIIVALLCGFIVWRRRRRAKAEPVVKIPPHELAFREIEKLIAEDLIGHGQIKPFYQRLTHILRHYIEDRFGLHSPEQTTEEFLADLRSRNTLQAGHKALLEEFLNHCDLVKFAEHQPATNEIQKTFDSCKEFIVGTQASELDTWKVKRDTF